MSANLPQPSVAEVFNNEGVQDDTIDSLNSIIRMRSRLLQVIDYDNSHTSLGQGKEGFIVTTFWDMMISLMVVYVHQRLHLAILRESERGREAMQTKKKTVSDLNDQMHQS